jgi:hypothetical protein
VRLDEIERPRFAIRFGGFRRIWRKGDERKHGRGEKAGKRPLSPSSRTQGSQIWQTCPFSTKSEP